MSGAQPEPRKRVASADGVCLLVTITLQFMGQETTQYLHDWETSAGIFPVFVGKDTQTLHITWKRHTRGTPR